ncbi:hypothetical protein [Kordiimonas sp. SCSIO 12610]|uniref:hypothetical protein n=1 Tax=Kordiimonas sp. SCSIO 12610 TaxID=2829597 RepID=UPI00210C1DED|nr:hypothetical protein [Kordiimonas sp. SCSIO 12610]UTW54914.1 hypothetical protein KFF44_14060 [Kordiimonas sp. SCSIO 12610]
MSNAPVKIIRERIKLHLADQGEAQSTLQQCEQAIAAYESVQTRNYIPVTPINALKPFLDKSAGSYPSSDKPRGQDPISLLSEIISNPELEITDEGISKIIASDVFLDYPLTTVATLFAYRKNFDLSIFLDTALAKTQKIESEKLSPIFWDYLVAFAFFKYQQEPLLPSDKSAKLGHIISEVKKQHLERGIRFTREALYSAIKNNIAHNFENIVKDCVTAKLHADQFAIPFYPVNFLFSREYIDNLLKQTSPLKGMPVSEGKNNDQCIITACDQAYFDRYFLKFLQKSNLKGWDLHIHCVNFRPNTKLLHQASEEYGICIHASFETYRLSTHGDAFGTWCATSRFWVLPSLLKRYHRCVVSDIDGYLKTHLIPIDTDPGIYSHTPTKSDTRLPWNNIYAGNMLFVSNEAIQKLCSKMAQFSHYQLIKNIEAFPKVHYFDQAVLLSFCTAYNIPLQYVEMFFEQNDVKNLAISKTR